MTKEYKVAITVYIEADSKKQAEALAIEQLDLDDDTKVSAEEDTSKKNNMAMWDSLDELTALFIKTLQEAGLGGEHLDKEELVEVAKEALEAIVPIVEKATGKEFVFIDCDY